MENMYCKDSSDFYVEKKEKTFEYKNSKRNSLIIKSCEKRVRNEVFVEENKIKKIIKGKDYVAMKLLTIVNECGKMNKIKEIAILKRRGENYILEKRYCHYVDKKVHINIKWETDVSVTVSGLETFNLESFQN